MLFTCGLLVLSLSKLSPIRESPVSGIPIVSFFSLVTLQYMHIGQRDEQQGLLYLT